MKLLVLPFALFLVVITVEGNLRGDHSDGDNVPRSLKKCKNMMGDRKSNVVPVVDTCCGGPKGRALTVLAIFRCSFPILQLRARQLNPRRQQILIQEEIRQLKPRRQQILIQEEIPNRVQDLLTPAG
jgi:hypothetical protein